MSAALSATRAGSEVSMFSVKMFDAENGVEKTIRHVVSVSIYNGQMRVKDFQEVEFVLPPDKFEYNCIYITDDIQTVDDWGE